MNIILSKASLHEDYCVALKKIRKLVSMDEMAQLRDAAVSEIKYQNARFGGNGSAFGWSGGKESVILAQLIALAGVRSLPILARTNLEFPDFDKYLSLYGPEELEVVNNGFDLRWLERNPEWLFPTDGDGLMKWYRAIQHRGQEEVCADKGISLMWVGRRTIDGNYVGADGSGEYAKKGVMICSPMRTWPNEAVLAYFTYYKLVWPPFYTWPRGFYIGSGAWAARNRLSSLSESWAEIDKIDRTVIDEAQNYDLPGLRVYVKKQRKGVLLANPLKGRKAMRPSTHFRGQVD